jgi:hypothetical protein
VPLPGPEAAEPAPAGAVPKEEEAAAGTAGGTAGTTGTAGVTETVVPTGTAGRDVAKGKAGLGRGEKVGKVAVLEPQVGSGFEARGRVELKGAGVSGKVEGLWPNDEVEEAKGKAWPNDEVEEAKGKAWPNDEVEEAEGKAEALEKLAQFACKRAQSA